MEFRTKREAADAVSDFERRATAADGRAKWARGHKREHEENAARFYRAEAARIRALLPKLEE